MKVTTESGATYLIENNICSKTSADGYKESPFKIWTMKIVDPSATTWDEVRMSPDGPPEIGKRMFVGGKDDFWLSTVVISIEK